MHLYGHGVKADSVEATKWFQKGADGGDSLAKTFLGN